MIFHVIAWTAIVAALLFWPALLVATLVTKAHRRREDMKKLNSPYTMPAALVIWLIVSVTSKLLGIGNDVSWWWVLMPLWVPFVVIAWAIIIIAGVEFSKRLG